MHVQVVHAVVLAGEHVDIASEMRQAADRLVGVAVCRRHDDRADATQRAAKVAVGVLDKQVGTPIVIEVGLGHLPTIFFRMVEVLDVCGQRTPDRGIRSEEHTSELKSLMRIPYAVLCLTKKKED